MTARHSRCWYCSRSGLELTDEHVLSQRNFGGRLVSRDAVCQTCNGTVGKLERHMVRGVFLAEYIGRDRLLFSPPLPAPEVEGITGDRAAVRVRHGPDGASIVSRTPRLVERRADGTEVWEVAAGDEDRVRERRLGQDPELKLEVIGRDPSDAAGLNTKYGIGEVNIDAWPRLGAKVALSLASLVLDEGWLDTRGSAALQTVLARGVYPPEVSNKLAFGPAELSPNEHPGDLLRPGEHLLGLDADHGGWVVLVLFGALYYKVPLVDADIPESHPTWHLKPREPVRGPLDADGLAAELRARRDA